MKQYDKIYVVQMDSPDRLVVGKWNEGEKTVVADAEVKVLSGQICLTLEELRGMCKKFVDDWAECDDSWRDECFEKDFPEYLQSKGIQIP